MCPYWSHTTPLPTPCARKQCCATNTRHHWQLAMHCCTAAAAQPAADRQSRLPHANAYLLRLRAVLLCSEVSNGNDRRCCALEHAVRGLLVDDRRAACRWPKTDSCQGYATYKLRGCRAPAACRPYCMHERCGFKRRATGCQRVAPRVGVGVGGWGVAGVVGRG